MRKPIELTKEQKAIYLRKLDIRRKYDWSLKEFFTMTIEAASILGEISTHLLGKGVDLPDWFTEEHTMSLRKACRAVEDLNNVIEEKSGIPWEEAQYPKE